MNKKYYHATLKTNTESILNEGIHQGSDRCVYLTDNPYDCCKFLMIRVVKPEDMQIFEVELPEEEVFESNDHSKSFFGCDAYCIYRDVEDYEITNIFELITDKRGELK